MQPALVATLKVSDFSSLQIIFLINKSNLRGTILVPYDRDRITVFAM